MNKTEADKKQEEDSIKKMIGSQGLEDLKTIGRLMPSEHRYSDPYYLACHLLDCAIEDIKTSIRNRIGIITAKENADSKSNG